MRESVKIVIWNEKSYDNHLDGYKSSKYFLDDFMRSKPTIEDVIRWNENPLNNKISKNVFLGMKPLNFHIRLWNMNLDNEQFTVVEYTDRLLSTVDKIMWNENIRNTFISYEE